MKRPEDENPLQPGHRRKLSREAFELMVIVIVATLAIPIGIAAWYFATHTESEIRTELGDKD